MNSDTLQAIPGAQARDAVSPANEIEYVVPVDPMDDLQCESCQ